MALKFDFTGSVCRKGAAAYREGMSYHSVGARILIKSCLIHLLAGRLVFPIPLPGFQRYEGFLGRSLSRRRERLWRRGKSIS
jgi:hypothetical protein